MVQSIMLIAIISCPAAKIKPNKNNILRFKWKIYLYIFIYVFIILCTHSQKHNYESKINTTAQVKKI